VVVRHAAVSAGDAGALAARIETLLASPDEARDEAARAAPVVRERFSATRMAAAYLDLYETIAPGGRARRRRRRAIGRARPPSPAT
jgi:glycosyltransferase involved in cell wall biosynthesis